MEQIKVYGDLDRKMAGCEKCIKMTFREEL